MIFGKIDYLNLLPFHVFLKRYPLPSYVKKTIEFKKGVPSFLCRELYNLRVDAAVISSIESRHKKYQKLPMGIVAKKEVISVLVKKNTPLKLDPASKSSNMLSAILGLKGEVIIGDRALKAYLSEGKEKFYDLGRVWHEKTGLPFVFGLFCATKNSSFYKKLIKSFHRQKIHIPQYILKNYSLSRDIAPKEIRWYLQYISYKIGQKERKALYKFNKEARALNYNPTKRA